MVIQSSLDDHLNKIYRADLFDPPRPVHVSQRDRERIA